jgi:hypothetical protein
MPLCILSNIKVQKLKQLDYVIRIDDSRIPKKTPNLKPEAWCNAGMPQHA